MMNDSFTHALSLHQSGRAAEAADIYRLILEENPDHPGAWHLLGVYLQSQGELVQAREHLERALALCETKAVYWNNYGGVLSHLGKTTQAKAAFERALSIAPDYPDALANLGMVRLEAGELDEAQAVLRWALKLQPRHVDALWHWAVLMRRRGNTEEALRACRDALAIAPDRFAVWDLYGDCLAAAKRLLVAAKSYRSALRVRASAVDTRRKLADVLTDLGEAHAAKEEFDRVARALPERPLLRWKRLGVCPVVFSSGEAVAAYRDQLEHELEVALARRGSYDWREAARDGCFPPFQLAHLGVCHRELKEKFFRLFASAFPRRRQRPPRRSKIRVGFVCAGRHEGGFIRSFAGILRNLDRRRFEVMGFVSSAALDYCRRATRADDVTWVGLPHQLEGAGATIRDAACNVLMHWHAGTDTLNYFLPFLPLAPVQCIGFGQHGTTGIPNLDYFVSSQLFERGDDAAMDYTERLIQFQGLTAWQPRPQVSGTPRRSEFDLPARRNLYFCPQRLAKLHPCFDALLAGVLDGDPDAELVLLAGKRPRAIHDLKTRLNRTLGARGLQRVRWLPPLNESSYHRLMAACDVVLDAPTYSASLTGFDALGLGVPLVTKPGALMVQRYALGLYRAIGIEDLVTCNDDAYIATAVRLGRDVEFRGAMSAAIRARSGVLFEQAAVVREYETFFERITREADAEAGRSLSAAVNHDLSVPN